MNPITRLEYYLAKIAGTWDRRTPEPITIEEYYLAIMTGDYSGNAPWPVTRLQYYMAKAAGVWSGNTPEPVTRVEQYWAAIANGGGNVPEPVTREEHLLSIIVGAHGSTVAYVSGNPIILTDAKDNAELKGLRIFGKSIQNGDPSPESPVPIVNAGGKGNIGIKIEGKNLIDIASGTKQGYNVTQPNLKLVPGQTYTFTNVDATTGVSLYEATTNTNLTKSHPAAGLSKAFVMPNIPNAVVILAGLNGDWNTGDLSTVKIQLELGPAATEYEPYKPAQKLIIPTPGGLPGIPVSSGGNYTDEKGQQWVCDEIDLAKGERVQWIEEYRFTGAEAWFSWGVNNITEGITGLYWYYGSVIPTNHREILNTHAVFSRNVYGGREEGTMANIDSSGDDYLIWSVKNEYLEDVSSKDAAVQSFKKLLGEINAKMLYCLTEPIRTPLSPEFIAAYKQLHTYAPTTTIINNEGAGMEVGYIQI